MQLSDLIAVLAEEALSNRDDLRSHALLIATLEDEAAEGMLDEPAQQYADFCSRASAASESLGLSGLARAASVLSEGLGMISGLPLEMRAPAGPLLSHWPDFFAGYLTAWADGAPDAAAVERLLAEMAAAEYLTPLDPDQFAELGMMLMTPPDAAAQQAELTPSFAPPDAKAMSLALPEDAEREVIEGFLAEGPALVERLAAIVAQLSRGTVSAEQMELAHRSAHTVKGTAAIAGIRGIATLAHALEDVLEAYRRADFKAPHGLHAALTAGCDQLELAIEHIAGDALPPAEFETVTRRLHAWASRLQGVEVPPEELIDHDAPEATTARTADAASIPEISSFSPAFTEFSTEFSSSALAGALATVATLQTQAPLPAADAEEEEAQIRIPVRAMDKIFGSINELSVGLLRLRMRSNEVLNRNEAMLALEQAASLRLAEIERRVSIDGLGRQSESIGTASNAAAPASDFDAIELDRYNELTGATQALSEAIGDLRAARTELTPGLRDVAALAQRQLEFARDAQHHIAQSRLRPLSDLRSRMRRIVRQTCSAVGQEAVLEITGDDLRVDAAVLGPLSEALLHLLRNSVDHGIEPPEARLAAGKPREGVIRLQFAALGGGIVTTIADDGKGLDYEAILDKAIWNELVPPDAHLTPEQIGRLIFLPGFSTRSAVTETSGRGVGLDAVSQAVASLQGNVSVTSQPGAGSRFRVFVLASVGTVHALHVVADGEHFLVPSIQLERAEIAQLPGDEPDADPTGAIPKTWLPTLLHGQRAAQGATGSARPFLAVKVDGMARHIEIDRIVEAREFLISTPPDLIRRLPGVSGVATLADGSLGLALDLTALARKPLPVRSQGMAQLQSALKEQLHILVVDDSTSVRNTLSALLRDANYKVSTARDGLEAMKAILDNRFALVLTDLEMPQLNGLELTDFIRNRSAQTDLPVIMLTSRGQDKHRLRATQVGVDAFLVKPYADQQLLDTVRAALSKADTSGRSPNRHEKSISTAAEAA
jgi:chemotaxis protein histidine kinase CheA/FixJ family two-component response regulator